MKEEDEIEKEAAEFSSNKGPVNPDELKLGPSVETDPANPTPNHPPMEETNIEGEDNEDLTIKGNPEQDPGAASDAKSILLMILGIIALFALLTVGYKFYSDMTGAVILNIDDMHQENLDGELDEEEGYVYNGYSFIYADGLWWTEMNKFGTLLKIPLHFGPKDLEEIEIIGNYDSSFNEGDKVYVAIDPMVQNKYYTLALSELSMNIVKGMDREPIGSCTEEHWACDNRTIISCENNPDNKPVVELSLEEGPGIEIIGACIKVKGIEEYNIVKSVNRLLYQWYGVMG